MHISTTIKKVHDLKTDTIWQVCPFCNAHVKELSYIGHDIYDGAWMGPSIHDHIAVEHGVQRVTKGKRQVWMDVSAEQLTEAQRAEEDRIRRFGKDSIKRVSDYYPPLPPRPSQQQEEDGDAE